MDGICEQQVISDLEWLQQECAIRRLTNTAKWATEMLVDIDPEGSCQYKPALNQQLATSSNNTDQSGNSQSLPRKLQFAQILIDNGEFARAAHHSELYKTHSALAAFIHLHALYLDAEKQHMDNTTDVTEMAVKYSNQPMIDLKQSIYHHTTNQQSATDPFIHYLHGVVLSALGLKEDAIQALSQALSLAPSLWCAWAELLKVTDTKTQLSAYKLPEHWMRCLFVAECSSKLQLGAQSVEEAFDPVRVGLLSKSTYAQAQLAAALHHEQRHEEALELFELCHTADPYRLQHMDIYSNTLFVEGMRVDLVTLAHHCFKVNKYAPETCMVIGNYYSLRGEHEQAVSYFERALKLDSSNAGAWVLMGHEFMELKNTAAACLAYHNALQKNKADHRAWYGLGQMYDILRMPSHAFYYYNMAHKSRPCDSRMLIALGEMYGKKQQYEKAIKCFWKANALGDKEGTALLKLAKLFQEKRIKENDKSAASAAATCFTKYLDKLEQLDCEDSDNAPECVHYLAEHWLQTGDYDKAHEYAQICLQYDTKKEDGKKILAQIAIKTQTKQKTADDNSGEEMDDSSMMVLDD